MHTGSNRLAYLNLPVSSAAASRAFFTALGFTFDDRFSDDTTACLQLSETAYVMLLERERFADFTAKPTGDPAASTSAILAVSAADRAAVDAFADTALAHGASPAKEPLDYGSMYGRSFYDLDVHQWEVMWMSEEAAQAAGAAQDERVGAG